MLDVTFNRDSVIRWLDEGFDHEQIAYIFNVTVEDVYGIVRDEVNLSSSATLDFLYEHKYELLGGLQVVRVRLSGQDVTNTLLIDHLCRQFQPFKLSRNTVKRMLPDLLDLESDMNGIHRSRG